VNQYRDIVDAQKALFATGKEGNGLAAFLNGTRLSKLVSSGHRAARSRPSRAAAPSASHQLNDRASLTARVGGLLEAFAGAPAGTIYDGELVAIAERAGRPAQDFAAVRRAIFVGDPDAEAGLRFVAFDLLALAGRDLRSLPWRERDAQLRDVVPVGERVRRIESLGATRAAHRAIVELGFEGTVLKRPGSLYRSGGHAAWRKHKALHTRPATLHSLHQDRERQWHAVCDADGHPIFVRASAGLSDRVGETIEVTYSRIDANDDCISSRARSPYIGEPVVGRAGDQSETASRSIRSRMSSPA
jgi:hypothetical protein